MIVTEHVLSVPLDHAQPGGETIEVFAREIAAHDGQDRPYLVYLQGGPGHEAPRPTTQPSSPSWLERALVDFRVLMLDQRGTGRSTPYGPPSSDPQADADRLRHFRADAIVQDAELFRQHLDAGKWSLLGQSFGGFCSLHYLSVAAGSLRSVFFTGGLPPVNRPVDDVYSATFAAMRKLNRRYHRSFPQDADRLRAILDQCDAGEVRLPSGDVVTRRLMRTIGNVLGKDGGAESIHYLLEQDPASPAFAFDLAELLPFGGRNPLYAVVHEASYANGGKTSWSAHRMLPHDFAGDSLLLTGEHLFPWHFEDTPELRPYRDVAAIVAETDWPSLYDADILSAVDVPCAAAIYTDDPYVDRQFSEETAELLPRMRPWITNEFLHSGLRVGGGRMLDRLISLAREA